MKCLLVVLLTITTLLTGCANPKTGQEATKTVTTKPSLVDSVSRAIYSYEQRLDIKMKRKRYEPTPNSLVTIQKWFEFGDTTRLVKLRKETLTGDTKMDIEQYHFIDGKLAKIHEYKYNKQCDGTGKQCMDEAEFFFDRETPKLAQKRHAEGTAEHTPVIEQASFTAIQPSAELVSDQRKALAQINARYASLPFPKPRPEQGTPVPVRR